MNKIELRIEDNYIIDLTTSLVSVEFNLKDIKEYDKRKTSFSKPITILHTPNTAKVFQNAYNLNRTNGYAIKTKVEAELLENDVTVLKGYLYLEDITYTHYECVIANNDVDLIQAVGDQYIHDLLFPAGLYSHQINKTHIINQWGGGGVAYTTYEGLKYTFIDYDNYINSLDDLKQDYPVMPSVHAWEILNKIVQDQGYSLEIEEPEILQHLVKIMIPCNRDIAGYLTEEAYLKSHFVTDGFDLDLIGTRARFVFNPTDYDNLEQDTIGIKDYLTVARTGNYKVTLSVTCKGAEDGDEIAVSSNIPFEDVEMSTTLSAQVQEVEMFFRKGDQIRMGFFYRQGYKAGNQIHMDTFIQLNMLDYFYNSQVIEMNDVLPLNYKQKDFLKDLFTIFNFHVQVDSFDSKKLYLRTYKKFYSGASILDWSKKIDVNSISFADISNQLSNEYIFTHAEDKDIHNADYKDKYGENLNTHKVLNDSEHSKGTTTISTTFPATAVKTVGGNIFLPAIYNKKGAREHKPRLLFLNRFAAPDKTVFNGDTFCTYVYTCTPYRNPSLGTYDLFLGFNNDRGYMTTTGDTINHWRTNKTLYNEFYKTEIESNLYDKGKILKAKFLLNITDVRPENFRNVVYIYDPKIGGTYFRINSISGYQKGKLCDVELTEIDVNREKAFSGSVSQTIIELNQSKLDELK